MSDTSTMFADGAAYERRMGRWSRIAGETFLDWLAAPSGLRWLDVGCGTGAFTEVLAARSAPAAVSGVDPSEAQIAYARAQSGAKLAEFRVAAAQDLPFADGSFDVATMALVISFVPEPSKAVAEMARVVRGGGLVAAYMWDIPGGGLPVAPMYRVMKATGVMTADPPGADVSRRETMRQVWETAGLQSVETCVIRVPVSYANFDDFWQSNSAPVGPSAQTLKAMAPDAKAELRERVRQSLPTDRDGRISYEAFANAVKGRVPQ